MIYFARIIIEALPERFNENKRQNFRTRHRKSLRWHRLVIDSFVLQRQPIPEKPLDRANITLIRHSSQCPDYDGLVQSFKPLVDGLVKAKIIIDDNMKVIGKPDYQWKLAPIRKGFVEIVVESV